MSKSPECVRNLIQSAPGLYRLVKQVEEHHWLLSQVQNVLPGTLAAHCRAAIWSEDRLTLYADSSAWASRLRYTVPELREWLAPRIPAIREIRVRLFLDGPAYPSSEKLQSAASRRLSAENCRLLVEIANQMGETELGAALRRLARHG